MNKLIYFLNMKRNLFSFDIVLQIYQKMYSMNV